MSTKADDIPEDLKTRYSDFVFLGSGAMGRVYKAHDQDLLIDVAIKLLLTNQTPDALVRFQREAQTASKLTHRNLVTIMNFGITGSDQLYLVMEYVKGRTLSAHLQSGPLKLSDAIGIISQVCEGMSHAHSLGVIHRDLKPANIIVEGDNLAEASIKVVDFGIAKLNSSATAGHTVTPQGNVLGTPLYMSPEQISSKEIDGRSDIYSTGCIFFHMLTGKLPQEGESTIELLQAKLNTPAPRVNEVREHSPVPLAVEDVVARCLSADPDGRFGTMAELKDALTRAMHMPEMTLGAPLDGAPARSNVKGIGLIALAVFVGSLVTFAVANRLWQVEPQHHNVEAAPTAVIKNNVVTVTTAVTDYFNRDPKKLTSWSAIPGVPDQAVAKLAEVDVVDLELCRQEKITPLAFRYLAKLPNLQVLNVSESALNDKGMQYLGKCKKIWKLNMLGTPLTDRGVASLAQLPLKDLNVESTYVTNEAMKSVAKMKALTRLIASRTDIDNDGLKIISGLPLNCLYLEKSKVNDAGMKFLPGKNTLKQLNLESTSVGESGLRQLTSYPLKELLIDQSPNVDDRCVEFIVKTWPNLIRLGVNDTKVTSVGIKSISRLKQLIELKISGLNLSDDGLAPVFELKNLESLWIGAVPITDKSLERITELPNLKLVEVTHCNKLTTTALASLRKRLPKVRIILPEKDVLVPGAMEMFSNFSD